MVVNIGHEPVIMHRNAGFALLPRTPGHDPSDTTHVPRLAGDPARRRPQTIGYRRSDGRPMPPTVFILILFSVNQASM